MTHDKQSGGKLVDAAFELLTTKYVQRADDRQREMGLQYTTAETHDLAETIAAFVTRSLPQAGSASDQGLVPSLRSRALSVGMSEVSGSRQGRGRGTVPQRRIAVRAPRRCSMTQGIGRTSWGIERWRMDVSKAIADIAAERNRQIEVEGWTLAHDDEHADGAMAKAAACYAAGSLLVKHAPESAERGWHSPVALWPWHPEWWKPSANKRRNLIKAAALLVAEIERIDRAEAVAA